MAMATTMEWEAPIPVWIESINIDVDDEDMATAEFMASIPIVTPTSSAKPTHSFLSSSTSAAEQQSMFGVLQDLKPIASDDLDMTFNVESVTVVAESPVKKPAMASTPRSMSPTKRKPTAKPARRSGRRIDVDPISRRENRKDKQRGYEKGYRKRQKDKRADDEVEWMQLEAHVRKLLAKRTAAVVVIGPQDEPATPASTVSIRQRYLELLQEERALREAEVLDRCMAARDVALSLWGTCATRRNVREQLNALPGLRECLTFEFSW